MAGAEVLVRYVFAVRSPMCFHRCGCDVALTMYFCYRKRSVSTRCTHFPVSFHMLPPSHVLVTPLRLLFATGFVVLGPPYSG